MRIVSFSKLLTSSALIGGLLVSTANADDRVLKITNWAEYIGEETITNFESEYGIKVIYDTYDSAESIDAKLLAGNSGYDVVSHSGSMVARLIKANIPSRMSFQVSSRVDSRTILDQGGAEQLLGHGDMLYLPPGTALPQRVHGAFVSDDEVHRVVEDWKQRGTPDYLEEIVIGQSDGEAFVKIDSDDDAEQSDELYDEAVAFVLESRRASISAVQRKLRIGYNRAARLIETMEAAGVVSAMNTNGSREVLVPDRNAQ